MAGAMAEMIRRQSGDPVVAPSMRERPVDDHAPAFAFADALLAGRLDMAVFLTGVGTKFLAEILDSRYPREEWVDALARIDVVARGPKPLAALRGLQVRVDVQVPEPNTWHELLAAVDNRRDLSGVRVAVQEYGAESPELIEGLQQRGAEILRVPVYRWALPEDVGPLRQAAHELADGQIDVALFTSAQQLRHLLQIAAEEGIEADVRDALARRTVVASIGPTTTEALQEHGLAADIEPEHPKMGHLVAAAASRWTNSPKARNRVPAQPRTRPVLPTDPLLDSRFLRACRRESVDCTPIWLMRQAGRYMAEYRELRAKVSFLDLCKRPELACEVTVTAANRLGVDAAILFADILLILEPLGFHLEFARGEGPIIHNPVREASDVDRVRPLEVASPLDYVAEAVRQIRAALPPHIPLIGFAGAPFTLACYAIEGGSSRHYDTAKSFMYRDSGAWNALMTRLTDATLVYLASQAHAGAQALQLFDSWVGTLGPDDYREFVQPHMKRLFDGLKPLGIPTIHFGTGTGGLLELQRDAGGDVIGLDWRIELNGGWDRLGPDVAVQGNLDPITLLAPRPELERQARRVLDCAKGRPGHIFNLGHGIVPSTPVDNVLALVDLVHESRSPEAG
jgi:uroporphyrinogen decarboxylase